MTNDNIQYFAFQRLARDLRINASQYDVRSKALMLVTFFALCGAWASEFNIVQLARFVGLNLTDGPQVEILRVVLSFYCGTGMITVIDNNLGLAEIVMNPGSPDFKRGENADITDTAKELEQIRNELKSYAGEKI